MSCQQRPYRRARAERTARATERKREVGIRCLESSGEGPPGLGKVSWRRKDFQPVDSQIICGRAQRHRRAQCVQNYGSLYPRPTAHLWVSLLGSFLHTGRLSLLALCPSLPSVPGSHDERHCLLILSSLVSPMSRPLPGTSPPLHHSSPAAPSTCWLTSCSATLGTQSRRSCPSQRPESRWVARLAHSDLTPPALLIPSSGPYLNSAPGRYLCSPVMRTQEDQGLCP